MKKTNSGRSDTSPLTFASLNRSSSFNCLIEFIHIYAHCVYIQLSQPLSQPLSPLPSSTNIRSSGSLHLYLSDALWILEAVLIPTRGDIYRATVPSHCLNHLTGPSHLN